MTAASGWARLEGHDPAAGILAYRVAGRIEIEQARELFDQIEGASREGRKLRLYYEPQGFPTASPGVVLEKLKRLGTILSVVERMALVGDQRWLRLYTAVFDGITKTELRHFGSDQKDQAWVWIRS